jgi:hypothetical protein
VTVYLDTNGDGTLDDGESTAITNNLGAYSFIGLAPGTYQVREAVIGNAPVGPGVTLGGLSIPIAASRQATRENLWNYFSSSDLVAGIFE